MYPTRTSRKTIEFENRKSVKELKPKKHPKGTPSKFQSNDCPCYVCYCGIEVNMIIGSSLKDDYSLLL